MKRKMKIGLEGMKFHAEHGFYEEEAIIGNEFVIDVTVETDFYAASQSDNLTKTINYEQIYKVCSNVMLLRKKLLEKIGEEIIETLKQQHPEILNINVRVQKLSPPFGGDVQSAFIEITQSFTNA